MSKSDPRPGSDVGTRIRPSSGSLPRKLASNASRQRNARSTLDQKIELLPVDRLKPYERRARTHDDNQIAMIMGSFEAFGFIGAIVADDQNRILAGHGRWEAAKRLGYEEVPVVRIDHLTEDEIRAYVIAENRIGERAGWDREILAIEFQHLMQIDLGFELDVTGFSIGEIDVIIGEAEAAGTDPADELPDLPGKAVSRTGDLWLLGEHRLLCGNALQAQSYEMLMAGEQARMALTDAPYNIPIDGFVSGLGKHKHRDFAMGVGEMSEAEFIAFLAQAMEQMKASLVDGGLGYFFMDHRHLFELLTAARQAELKQVNLCVWDKTTGVMGSFYRSQHELCLILKNGDAPFLNNVELGRHGRNRTNVWPFPGLSSFGRGRDEALASHPTVKPVHLLAEAIKDCTKRGDIVLDPFLGSGSTLIAAEKTGRRGYGMELDPLYVDTIIIRWEKLTGEKAVHGQTDIAFAEISKARNDEDAGFASQSLAIKPARDASDPLAVGSVGVRHRSRAIVSSTGAVNV